MALDFKSGLDHLTVEVPRSHTVGLLLTSDQPGSEAATYTTHNKPNRRSFVPSAGMERAITSSQTAADLRVRPDGQRDQLIGEKALLISSSLCLLSIQWRQDVIICCNLFRLFTALINKLVIKLTCTVYLFVYLFAYLCICLFIFIYLFAYLFICFLFIYLLIN